MEQVSLPLGKGQGRAGPGAPRPLPPPGCSEGGGAVPGGGRGRSRRKPGPSRGRGCSGRERGRGGGPHLQSRNQKQIQTLPGPTGERAGRPWSRGRGGRGRNVLAGGVWRGWLSQAARGGPHSRVPGSQASLECSWGYATCWVGVWLLPRSGPSGRGNPDLKAGAKMLPLVCTGYTQDSGSQVGWRL